MAVFRRVPPEGQKGKVSYNPGIVSGIIHLAVSEVEGVTLLGGKKKGLKVYFEKGGIYADITVTMCPKSPLRSSRRSSTTSRR